MLRKETGERRRRFDLRICKKKTGSVELRLRISLAPGGVPGCLLNRTHPPMSGLIYGCAGVSSEVNRAASSALARVLIGVHTYRTLLTHLLA